MKENVHYKRVKSFQQNLVILLSVIILIELILRFQKISFTLICITILYSQMVRIIENPQKGCKNNQSLPSGQGQNYKVKINIKLITILKLV